MIHVLTPGAKIEISWRWTLPCDQLTGDSLNFARQFSASSRSTPTFFSIYIFFLLSVQQVARCFFSVSRCIDIILFFPNLFYKSTKKLLWFRNPICREKWCKIKAPFYLLSSASYDCWFQSSLEICWFLEVFLADGCILPRNNYLHLQINLCTWC
jgi:hypothetical protein